jgi:VanZ family protein
MGDHRRGPLRRVLDWVPAALAVLMIMGESTATMSAANTSRWLLPIWVHLFGPISGAHWAVIHHLLRKTGHLVGYGVVSLCFFHGWRRTLHAAEGQMPQMWRKAALLALACTLIVASADEYHQSFLPGRTSSPVDVGIDMCGGMLAQLLILKVMPRITRRREAVPVSA